MRRVPPRNAAAADQAPDVTTIYRSADVVAASINDADRTVDIVWTTGAAVLRYDWFNDLRFYEELSLDRGHVRMGRLNDGAPLLDSHSGYGLDGVMGVVEDNSATLGKNEGRARVRFASEGIDENADKVFRKVQDKIIRKVSVGYRIYKLEKTNRDIDGVPVYRATDWEPFEVSFVALPADAGAGVRDAKGDPGFLLKLIARADAVAAGSLGDSDRLRSLQLARARAGLSLT
jgi:hypothetical protein